MGGAPRRPLNYCDYGQRQLGSEVRGAEQCSKCSGAENADGGDQSGHRDVPRITKGRLIPDCFRIASPGSQNGFFHDRVMSWRLMIRGASLRAVCVRASQPPKQNHGPRCVRAGACSWRSSIWPPAEKCRQVGRGSRTQALFFPSRAFVANSRNVVAANVASRRTQQKVYEWVHRCPRMVRRPPG